LKCGYPDAKLMLIPDAGHEVLVVWAVDGDVVSTADQTLSGGTWWLLTRKAEV
jgi:hypothetical protein